MSTPWRPTLRHQPEPAVTDHSPQDATPPLDDAQQRNPPPTTRRQLVPWRSFSAVGVSLGIPVGTGILHPVLGEAFAAIEMTTLLTIVATALFGNAILCERAFRLLRWLANRSEPRGPSRTAIRNESLHQEREWEIESS
jgi:hypothetical protein